MKYKKFENLSVIQSIFGDWLWKITSPADDSETDAELQIHKVPREVDDYKLCGLYDKVPGRSTIYEVEYKKIEGMRVHEEIVNAYFNTVSNALLTGDPLLMAGGHCTWAPGIVGAIKEYLGEDKKIGIIWIDAHGDIKTEITSDNRLIAGMPLGTILGLGMERWRIAGGLKEPLDGKYTLISDYRIKTPEVEEDFKNAEIRTLDQKGFNDPVSWKDSVNGVANQVDAIYLHVDIDILKNEYVPTFLFEYTGGNDLSVVMNNIKTVMETDKVLAFGVYNSLFDSDLPGQEITTLNCMKLIASGLDSWKNYPSL